MASKASKLKREIRALNATIDSNLRVLNQGHSGWLEAIADPTFPNITANGLLTHRREANIHRRAITRQMCAQLHILQTALIALEKKQAAQYQARAERRWNETRPMTLIPVLEYVWTDDMSFMRELTCIHHPTARYLTKNPFSRTLHVVNYPNGMTGECTCPLRDLAVIVR